MRPLRTSVTCFFVLASAISFNPSETQGRQFNWDALGAAFCQATVAGDMAQVRPFLTGSLARTVDGLAGHPNLQSARTLFQSYTNEVPACSARTLNAALVEITRSNPGGAAPLWREYLVVVPEIDGTSRIDDVLFATRRSDTLRARLGILSN